MNDDTALSQAAERRRFPELGLRVVSAAVLIGLSGAATWYGYPWFDLMIAVAAAAAVLEWSRLCGGLGKPAWLGIGLIYLAAAATAMLWLRHEPAGGRATLLWLIATVAAVDTGAYFAGRAIGGPRLAPLISPKKTWAGLLGGTICAGACGVIAAAILDTHMGEAAFWSALLGPVSQIGDIVESAVKRHFGVKDSGNIIPGHGGILDRIDGLVMAALFIAAVRLLGGEGMPWQ